MNEFIKKMGRLILDLRLLNVIMDDDELICSHSGSKSVTFIIRVSPSHIPFMESLLREEFENDEEDDVIISTDDNKSEIVCKYQSEY